MTIRASRNPWKYSGRIHAVTSMLLDQPALFNFEIGSSIKPWEWGVYWARWSDAIREAGLSPNQLNISHDKAILLDRLARLSQELGKIPAASDIRLKAHHDKTFPSHNSWKRFGTKSEQIKELLTYCQDRRSDYADVVKLCEEYSQSRLASTDDDQVKIPPQDMGFVYLVKSGRFYKIGRSNATGRRTYELDLQLPEKTKTVHVIRTDDPAGIEVYWHTRFAPKRKNGEWFDLDATEVSAFKRRKTM